MQNFAQRIRSAVAERYTIERELGRGGMATVYLARDDRHHRHVAVKVLYPELFASVSAERFLREIRIAAGLTHPNILPLYDSGETDGLLYYVMPYIEGETLRQRLARETQLPLAEALDITRGVADALAYAHDRGVVHRDIKPENILLLAGGHAIVADFGIARALHRAAGETLTSTGVIVGTPAYMSPEQAGGARAVDGRSDIYSLGCVLFEMLAGVPPFRGPNPQVVVSLHQTEPPPRLRAFRGTVPESLEAAVGRALAKSPADRFTTARELVDWLVGGTPVVITPPAAAAGALATHARQIVDEHPPPDHTHARRRRSKRLVPSHAVAVAAFVLVVTAVAVVMLVQQERAGRTASREDVWLVIAPFNVFSADSAAQHWGEEAVSELSYELDDAGDLRAVQPSVADEYWSAHADASSAAVLARRTGARFVLYGTRSDIGRDSLRLTAALLEVTADSVHTLRDFHWDTRTDQLTAFTDSLARGVLAVLGEHVAVGAVRGTWLGSLTSEPARKEFLRGERYFRRSDWASAIEHYERALAADSNFPLPLRRIAMARGWQSDVDDSLSLAYYLRAGSHNHGLPPRESLLVAIDSQSAALEITDDETARFTASQYWSLARRLFTSIDLAVKKYPRDPEVWYMRGDARYHYGFGPAAVPPSAILADFDSAIALDSGFAPSYLHAIEIAYLFGRDSLALRYARKYLSLNTKDVSAEGVRLALRLSSLSLPPPSAGRSALDALVDTVDRDPLIAASNTIDRRLDSAQVAVELTGIVARRDLGLAASTGCEREQPSRWTRRLAYRGRLREAWCRLGARGRRESSLVAELALVGGIPDDTAKAIFAHWLEEGSPSAAYALPWWSEHRDTASIHRFLTRADSIARLPPSVERESAHRDTAAARAYLALARGDTADALRRLLAAPDTLCRSCFLLDQLVRARLLLARGDVEAARKILDGWLGSYVRPLEVVVALEGGRAAERAGDRAAARAAYQMVVDAWSRADPVLRPKVDSARAGLARCRETG